MSDPRPGHARRTGAELRILLIGNIANNAFHNARLLRQTGDRCDVLCPDYYHVMGCPEWEDADFAQADLDDFRPDWASVDLCGYERPTWFVQGPLEPCLAYLEARNAGRTKEAARLWRTLSLLNRTTRPSKAADLLLLARHHLLAAWLRALRFAVSPTRVAEKTERWRRAQSGALASFTVGVGGVALLATSRVCARLRTWWLRDSAAHRDFRSRTAVLIDRFNEAFPEREDRLSEADLAPFAFHRAAWQRVMADYDIVQAYAADVAIPLVGDVPFTAFEHGTLRNVPFQPTVQGRLTALGFNAAEHTFVTNFDCLDNARALTGNRCSFINHPYDEAIVRGLDGVADLRARLCAELDAEFLVFHPTRHDWAAGSVYADKGNDVLLEAIAELRKRWRIGLVCCAWGHDVERSRDLIARAGLGVAVAWRRPMAMVEFARHVSACDVTADQFRLGAFGGITFKALAASGLVCTFLDTGRLAGLFAEPPPVLNAADTRGVVAALSALEGRPEAIQAARQRSRAWIDAHHRGAQLVEHQHDVYAALLKARGGASAAA